VVTCCAVSLLREGRKGERGPHAQAKERKTSSEKFRADLLVGHEDGEGDEKAICVVLDKLSSIPNCKHRSKRRIQVHRAL